MRLSVRGVTVRFGPREVLSGIDFEVPSGGLEVILGGSGSGKSVLLRTMNGLEKPDSGEVTAGETSLAGLGAGALARIRLEVGYVFQYSALFDSLSVFENVAWAAREHRRLRGAELSAEAARCLERVGLGELVGAMERTAPATLSGGRRKRVALARALALSPRALLHDEPTSGLDPASSRAIGELIASLNRAEGLTTVVVTHDVELARRLGGRISLLAGGRFAFQGSAEQFDARRQDADIKRYLDGEAT